MRNIWAAGRDALLEELAARDAKRFRDQTFARQERLDVESREARDRQIGLQERQVRGDEQDRSMRADAEAETQSPGDSFTHSGDSKVMKMLPVPRSIRIAPTSVSNGLAGDQASSTPKKISAALPPPLPGLVRKIGIVSQSSFTVSVPSPLIVPSVLQIALPEPQPLRLVDLPKGGRVTILHLSDKTCKWPIGDPGSEDFCFCGHSPRDKSPYCEYHARAAYQPMQDRRHRKFG